MALGKNIDKVLFAYGVLTASCSELKLQYLTDFFYARITEGCKALRCIMVQYGLVEISSYHQVLISNY